MSKNVLILSGSPRKSGNSDLLCNEFMRSAIESGNTVEKIRVSKKKQAIRALDTGKTKHNPDAPGVGEWLISNYPIND